MTTTDLYLLTDAELQEHKANLAADIASVTQELTALKQVYDAVLKEEWKQEEV